QVEAVGGVALGRSRGQGRRNGRNVVGPGDGDGLALGNAVALSVGDVVADRDGDAVADRQVVGRRVARVDRQARACKAYPRRRSRARSAGVDRIADPRHAQARSLAVVLVAGALKQVEAVGGIALVLRRGPRRPNGYTLSLHDALPIFALGNAVALSVGDVVADRDGDAVADRQVV